MRFVDREWVGASLKVSSALFDAQELLEQKARQHNPLMTET